MNLDLEQIMILLQRRYRAFQEISRLTSELGEAVSRRDEVSASLLLEMRADEISVVDTCYRKIWDMAQAGPEAAYAIRQLITSDPAAAPPSESFEEQKIYEIRRKTTVLIKEIQEKDRILNRRVGGERSFYAKTSK